jgi:hypothetical protein
VRRQLEVKKTLAVSARQQHVHIKIDSFNAGSYLFTEFVCERPNYRSIQFFFSFFLVIFLWPFSCSLPESVWTEVSSLKSTISWQITPLDLIVALQTFCSDPTYQLLILIFFPGVYLSRNWPESCNSRAHNYSDSKKILCGVKFIEMSENGGNMLIRIFRVLSCFDSFSISVTYICTSMYHSMYVC